MNGFSCISNPGRGGEGRKKIVKWVGGGGGGRYILSHSESREEIIRQDGIERRRRGGGGTRRNCSRVKKVAEAEEIPTRKSFADHHAGAEFKISEVLFYFFCRARTVFCFTYGHFEIPFVRPSNFYYDDGNEIISPLLFFKSLFFRSLLQEGEKERRKERGRGSFSNLSGEWKGMKFNLRMPLSFFLPAIFFLSRILRTTGHEYLRWRSVH